MPGAMAWYRVALECKGGKGELRMDTMRDAVRDPPQLTSYSDALAQIANWETALRKFEKEFPQKRFPSTKRARC